MVARSHYDCRTPLRSNNQMGFKYFFRSVAMSAGSRPRFAPANCSEWGFQDRCLKPLLSPAKKSPMQVASELKRNQFIRLVKDDFGTSTSDSAKQTENDQY